MIKNTKGTKKSTDKIAEEKTITEKEKIMKEKYEEEEANKLRSDVNITQKERELINNEVIDKDLLDYLGSITNKTEKEENHLIFEGEKGLSKLYSNYKEEDVKITDVKKGNGYCFNQHKALWEDKESNYFTKDVSDFLETQINQKILNYLNYNKKENKKLNTNVMDAFKGVLKSCRRRKYVEDIFNFAKCELHDKSFFGLLNKTKHIISFKNGVYDLKTKQLRPRQKIDYLSEYIQYDYVNEVDEKVRDEVINIFKNISNDDNDLFEFNMDWLGYCLTGETKKQKFLIILGDKASNGKSTMLKMMEKVFPIYCFKADSSLFEMGNSKRHKTFAELNKSPSRILYIEELSKKKQDIESIKNFVDGNSLRNEIMFGTTEIVEIQSKLIIITNKDSMFDTDNGIIRRGIKEELTNRFISKRDYDKAKNKKGLYIKNEDLLDKFEGEYKYKLALAQIIINRASKYYEKGLKIPEKLEESFKNLADENDEMKQFLDRYFILTNNEDDIISKNEFVYRWNDTNKSKVKWAYLMSDVKRHVNYDCETRRNGVKGILTGIRHKTIEDEDEELKNEQKPSKKKGLNIYDVLG